MTATIEEVKKYWDDRPCNVRHSTKDVGTREYFDEVEKKRYTAEPVSYTHLTLPTKA